MYLFKASHSFAIHIYFLKKVVNSAAIDAQIHRYTYNANKTIPTLLIKGNKIKYQYITLYKNMLVQKGVNKANIFLTL